MKVQLRYDRNLVFWLVVLGMVTMLIFPIYANDEEIQQKRQELEAIEQDSELLRQDLQQTEHEKMNTRQRLMETRQELSQAEAELSSIESDIEETESKIKRTTERLQEKEEELEEKEEFLAERLRASYKNGDLSYLEVLFEADSFIDFLSRFNYINRIVDKDVELIEEVEEKRDVIKAHKEELEEQEAELNSLFADAREQKETIEAKAVEERQLLSQLEQEVQEYERRIAQKEEEAHQIEEMLARLESDGDGLSTPIEWPVPSTSRASITSPYGNRTHPIYNVRMFHSGIDIGASQGSEIVAVDSGVVVDAGVRGSINSGYGRLVIIDHGEGHSTLYAHNSTNLVSEGEKVARGQAIARIGATGTATGPHLHFEVLINGEHTNPMDYFN